MKKDLIIGTDPHGKPFYLPLETTTATIAILAVKGKGKTYLADVINEELMQAGQVPIIIDYTGAHWGLKSSADGRKAGFPVVIFGGEHADLPLEEGAGEIIARAIVEGRFPAIVDLSLLRKGESNRFLAVFLETLYRLNRQPVQLVCDEADAYAPQKPFGDQARTLGAIEDIVRRGRIRGIGCMLITQRPAVINKNVLTQCEILVALGMGHPKDIGAIKEWIDVHGDKTKAAALIASLPALPRGTAWFWAPSWDLFDRVAVRQRQTFDSSATPKPGEAMRRPQKQAEIDIAALGAEIAATAARAKENDPATLKARIRSLEMAKKPAPAAAAAAAGKVKIREVPVIAPRQEKKMNQIYEKLGQIAKALALLDKTTHSLDQFLVALDTEIKNTLSNFAGGGGVSGPAVEPGARQRPVLPPRVSTVRPSPAAGTFSDSPLPVGEKKILTACAQYADGLKREQLTVLTGYKKSSRDVYIQRLNQRGYLERNGDRITCTAAGRHTLGNSFQPLPTGNQLREHYLQMLPQGETKILRALVLVYPDAMTRDEISVATAYMKSSRDVYLQRMASRQIIEFPSRGEVRASANLFD